MVVSSKPSVTQQMEKVLEREEGIGSLSRSEAVKLALRTWAVSQIPPPSGPEAKDPGPATAKELDGLLKQSLETRTVEVALLDGSQPGSSKYRNLESGEVKGILKGWLK
jgi:hypothetical protein